jgi:hypothetical protein
MKSFLTHRARRWGYDGWALKHREPVPPPDVRPVDDAAFEKALEDRDHYHDIADKLAEAVGALLGVEVGEHSSDNCPWEAALEAYESSEVPDVRELVEAAFREGFNSGMGSAQAAAAWEASWSEDQAWLQSDALAKFRGQS